MTGFEDGMLILIRIFLMLATYCFPMKRKEDLSWLVVRMDGQVKRKEKRDEERQKREHRQMDGYH